jgi:Fe-S-cluster containining protein
VSITCEECDAVCCKYFALEIDKPTTRNDFENIRWYISHQKTSVFIQDGKWYLNVKNRCKYLDANNRCKIYERRPAICRRLDPDRCEYHDRNAVREIKTPKQLERYLEEKPIRRKRKRRI